MGVMRIATITMVMMRDTNSSMRSLWRSQTPDSVGLAFSRSSWTTFRNPDADGEKILILTGVVNMYCSSLFSRGEPVLRLLDCLLGRFSTSARAEYSRRKNRATSAPFRV